MKFSFSEKARLRTTSQSASQTMPDCGSQRLLRCRLHPAGRGPNSDSLFPPLAAVVAVAPSRGASGEEAKLYEIPRPPLGRSNSDDCSGADRCQLRMLEPQPGHRVRRESYRLLYSCRGAIHPSSVSLTSTNKKSRSALLQALRLSSTLAVEAEITSPCLRLQQRSRQNASPGPRP